MFTGEIINVKLVIKHLQLNILLCDIQKCIAKKVIMHVISAMLNSNHNLIKSGMRKTVNKNYSLRRGVFQTLNCLHDENRHRYILIALILNVMVIVVYESEF